MKSLKKMPFYEWVFLLVLLLYPLRHVNIGIDFWDTGYNYANFTYGLNHMDPMWFFSTYLANVVGHFFSILPFGNTLIGLNAYTASTISICAIATYFFLKGSLKIPSVIAFLGLFLSINLCWCPTALMYNYLTYLFLLLCTIFLYKGLAEHKNKYLFVAGLFLGANVLVRFSNAAEAALIVGVWAYAFIEALYDEEVAPLKWKLFKSLFWKRMWSRTWRTTLWCLGGYLSSLVALLGYISIRYGLGTYVEAITRLFGMTEESTAYSPLSMLMTIYYSYRKSLVWFIYLVIYAVGAWVICLIISFFSKWIHKYLVIALQSVVIGLSFVQLIEFFLEEEMFSLNYHTYASMTEPVYVLLILTMLIAALKVIWPGVSKEEKLISGLIILVNFITSIGSNNGALPSINNTFILMSYFLWQLYKFFRDAKFLCIRKWKISLLPLWGFLTLYTCFMAYQSVGYGSTFVFAEATGIVDAHSQVENNEVLAGVNMQADRAVAVTQLSDYIAANDLKGRCSITFDYRPALAFYFELPPAFNAWLDLASYQIQYMEEAMDDLDLRIAASPDDLESYPVLITTPNAAYAVYDGAMLETTVVKKWLLLSDFLEKYDYQVVFENEFFVMYDVPLAK